VGFITAPSFFECHALAASSEVLTVLKSREVHAISLFFVKLAERQTITPV